MNSARACMVLCSVAITLTLVSPAHASPNPNDRVPDGLSSSDWSSIRAACDANRHAAFAINGGYQTRNPGQAWRTVFDGRGFVTTPDAGRGSASVDNWSWGLELVNFGREGIERNVTTPSCVDAQGGRVEYEWDDNLTEWYINDHRGLEHGYTVQQRPQGSGLLQLTLSVRGHLHGKVSIDGSGVTFVNEAGAAVVNYNGLKVFDATGAEIPARFERVESPSTFSILHSQFITIVIDDSNAIYPLTIDPLAQQAYIKASNTDAGDGFGAAIAISADILVIGAPNEDSNATGVNGNHADNSAANAGAAYVFVRDSGGGWYQQAYLKASNTDAGDNFGAAVDVAGDTVIVGAFQERSNATGVNGNQADNSAAGSGAAYVFVRDSAGFWSQQAYLKASNTQFGDYFGSSVTIGGNNVAVGAPFEDSAATGVNGNQADNTATDSGAVYVFTRSGTTWTQQAYLKASNTDPNDDFGERVSYAAGTLVVGATNESSNATGVNGNQANNSASASGAAYVFVRNSGVWSQQAYLKASNADADDEFGVAVSISGDTVIIGAHQEDSNATGVNGNQANNSAVQSGAAYVFVRSGTTWSQQAYLKASNTEAFDGFGVSVAISGNRAAVGAHFEDSSASGVDGNQADNSTGDAGAAYLFERSGTTWSQLAYLKASNPDVLDHFGTRLALTGSTVVVGAPVEASNAIGINGNQADNSASLSGAAYLFIFDTDGDGVDDSIDVCPDNAPGLPVCANGRPQRDCNNDCLYDAADIQCLVDELLNQ